MCARISDTNQLEKSLQSRGFFIENYRDTKFVQLKSNWLVAYQEKNLFVLGTITPSNQPEKQIKAWFERLGISDKINSKVEHMSFGQQQRAACIRALVQPFNQRK